MFDRFWNVYPKKVSRGAALRKWNQIKPSQALGELIIKAVEDQLAWRRRTEDANKDKQRWKHQFIPNWKHPATWLHQQCWMDEIPDAPKEKKKQTTYCHDCQREQAKAPIQGVMCCIRCYDVRRSKAMAENFQRIKTA